MVRASGAAALVAALLGVPGGPVPAQAPNGPPSGLTLVRVEEDWSLTVNQPDSTVASPQVATQMARSTTTHDYSQLRLNSTNMPSFAAGGLQLQSWHDSQNLAVYTPSNNAVMGTTNELVTWTQYLRVNNGQLYFGVGTQQSGVAGAASTTWGNFSGVEVQVTGATADLSYYDRSYSEHNSGVTYGANRVNSFTLVKVRYYYSDGSVVTDSNAHVMYSSQLSGL
jgi:hypothetical protein